MGQDSEPKDQNKKSPSKIINKKDGDDYVYYFGDLIACEIPPEAEITIQAIAY